MRIKSGYELENCSGEHIIVSENGKIKDIVFSDITVFLWNLLKKGDATKGQMLDGLLNSFEISTVLALGEIDTFIRTLKENEIIE